MFVNKVTTINGKRKELLWPESDVGCYDIILFDWQQYASLIGNFTPTRKLVIQAGGNCGMYPLFYAETFDRVVTFEPEPINFYCLASNCKSNKIIKFNTALSNECDFVNIGITDLQNNGMAKIGAGDVVVYSMTIDSLCLEEVSLIHLDIEGHEYDALLGAEETIKKCKPTIVVEVTDKKEEIFKLMKHHNYIQAAKFALDPENYIFIPKEATL